MNDRPTSHELLDAVETFLRQDIIPSVEGHLRYQARVAANVVAIVAREIDLEESHWDEEWKSLKRLLAQEMDPPSGREARQSELEKANQDLSTRIRAGEADEGEFRKEVVAHLEKTVQAKLEVALGNSGSS
ncbi:MAG: DUF6285 domain-containing protein [Myxococcota bacterium]|nr:DUF6285 domain-containing protein [Myxococcota bacterium]